MRKTLAFLLCLGAAASALAQICPDTTGPEPFPLVVVITGKDAKTGEALYTRYAYVFLGPINQPGFSRELPIFDVISVWRQLRPDGERCNVAAPVIIETGYTGLDYCTDPTPATPTTSGAKH